MSLRKFGFAESGWGGTLPIRLRPHLQESLFETSFDPPRFVFRFPVPNCRMRPNNMKDLWHVTMFIYLSV